MSTASKTIKEKQLPERSILIEIYSVIARFHCNSTALVDFHPCDRRTDGRAIAYVARPVYMLSRANYNHIITVYKYRY